MGQLGVPDGLIKVVEMKELTEFEKGWLSGLIDGEGSLVLREKKEGNTLKPSITISNNSKELMEKLKTVMPFGKIYEDSREDKDNWSKTYQFKIWKQKDIKRLLEQIKDNLVIKNKKAELLIQFCKIREDYSPLRDNKGRFTETSQNPEEKRIYKDFNHL